MARTDWTSIRIRRSTLQALHGVVKTLERATEQGQYAPMQRHDRLVTIDDAIVVLISRDQAKRERAKKSRQSKKRSEVHTDDTSATVEG